MRSRHFPWWIPALILLAGCGNAPPSTPASTPPESPPAPLRTIEIPPVEARAETTHPPLPNTISSALYDQFVPGMTFEAARNLSALSPQPAGGDSDTTALYRWEDEAGNYFTARFESGVLTARSGLRHRRSRRDAETPPPVIEEIHGEPAAQVAPGVFVPLKRAIASSVNQPLGVTAPQTTPPAPLPDTAPQGPAAARPTVVVAGASRRSRDAEKSEGAAEPRSYNPRARLPEFTRSLPTGRYEIRFHNPLEVAMTVGIRQEKRGQDVSVPANGHAACLVEQGTYALFFLIDDEPEALYEARSLVLDPIRNTGLAVHLNRDDVQVRPIDYTVPQ